ncbi:MAG: PQQ-binding-like beta-propeller repeat protein, partial [Planctomycetales bacterium]|nr:PQQ-binding-like beta-propeller repeat protein [Planctomycetales bacterium]
QLGGAAALCSITDPADTATLLPLLDDRDDRVALEVAQHLADLGDRRVLPVLVRLLDAESVAVRVDAAVTLRGLTGRFMGYAAYESAAARHEAVKKWSTWIADEGKTAALTFPVPRHSGARGDLAGNTLIATGSKGEVFELDPSGKRLWVHPIDSWSAEKLQDGDVLIASYTANKVIVVEPTTQKVVWEFAGLNAMTAKPLANGNFLVSDFRGKRAVEIARNKQIVWEQALEQECFDCDRLPSGNTICGSPNFVREYTHDHKLVREWKIEGRLNGFQALPNGNVLVANFGKSEVVELTPDGKQLWRVAEPGPCDVYRLPSGATLISTQQRVIEVDAEGKV